MKREVVAFVHAKGCSERVPGKNLRRLGDRPLFCHAITHACAARAVDRVIIDSDSDDILAVGAEFGAEPLKRPARLATNLATGDDLARWQAENAPDSGIVLQVIPTSPFIRPGTLDTAVDLIRIAEVDSVVGVFSEALYHWEDGKPAYLRPDRSIPNSVDLKPTVYETTGLYVNRTAFVLREGRRMNPESCRPVELSRLEAMDINVPEDFELAEIIWRGLQAQCPVIST